MIRFLVGFGYSVGAMLAFGLVIVIILGGGVLAAHYLDGLGVALWILTVVGSVGGLLFAAEAFE